MQTTDRFEEVPSSDLRTWRHLGGPILDALVLTSAAAVRIEVRHVFTITLREGAAAATGSPAQPGGAGRRRWWPCTPHQARRLGAASHNPLFHTSAIPSGSYALVPLPLIIFIAANSKSL